uniref:CAZy families GT9 protein n=1 Tax=uncultured Flavobacterium sp. TaxID=165435 RepID=A0A060BWJ5_9FLAO|nr:CAZy families GT9 protein [uncultured Flavobacterium sp.]
MEVHDVDHMAKNPVYNIVWLLTQIGIIVSEYLPDTLNLRLTAEELAVGSRKLRDIVQNDKPTIMFYTYATGNKCMIKQWWMEMYDQLERSYGMSYNLLEILT